MKFCCYNLSNVSYSIPQLKKPLLQVSKSIETVKLQFKLEISCLNVNEKNHLSIREHTSVAKDRKSKTNQGEHKQ